MVDGTWEELLIPRYWRGQKAIEWRGWDRVGWGGVGWGGVGWGGELAH